VVSVLTEMPGQQDDQVRRLGHQARFKNNNS